MRIVLSLLHIKKSRLDSGHRTYRRCKNGHEFTNQNTILTNGKRNCRDCKHKVDARNRRKSGKKIRASLVDVGVGKRLCSECNVAKELNEFYRYKGGYRGMCKICFKGRGW